MAGNNAVTTEDWFLLLPGIRHPPRLLETQHRSNLAHRPRHSTLPVLRGAARGEALSEGEGDGVLGLVVGRFSVLNDKTSWNRIVEQ